MLLCLEETRLTLDVHDAEGPSAGSHLGYSKLYQQSGTEAICFCRCQGVLSGFFEYGTKVSYRLYTLSRNHRFHKQRGNQGYDCEQYLCDSIKS